MATKPTPGGSDGTYGTELNEFLDVSLASDGKVKTEALQTDATAPVADAAVANKKYVDDQIAASVAKSAAKAWGHVESDGTLKSGSLNLTSVTRAGAGLYDVVFDTNFSDSNYVVVVTVEGLSTGTGNNTSWDITGVGTCRIITMNSSGTATDAAFSFAAFGNQ